MTRLTWHEEDVQTGPIRLHVRRIVDPPASPILLLHGLGVSGAIWQPFARRLLPAYAAVAPDLRGHGRSDAPPDGYAPDVYARDLALLIEGLQLGHLPVLGHSLGALVALCLAAARPDLVSAAVLVDPPLDPRRRNADIRRVSELRSGPPGALEDYLLEQNPGGGKYLVEFLAAEYRRAADQAFEAVLDATPGFPEVRATAPSVAQPVLVVRGDPSHGGVLGEAAARGLVDDLSRGRLLAIDGASHAVHATHPRELAEGVLRFLAEAAA